MDFRSSTSAIEKFQLPARFGNSRKQNMWAEYEKLAANNKILVNLGRGFPEIDPPTHVVNALVESVTEAVYNQSTRGLGHPRLVKNLARLYSPLIGRALDPETEILVTSGAYEALYCAISGHVDTGDEVIMIQPFFDCYDNMVKTAGGTPKYISLQPKKTGENTTSADWVLDETELASLFTGRTKMFILNTPNNPLGKVFTVQELETIANLCKKHNVLCLSDEVYEWMVYEPQKHIRIATLPGMWERTITVGSAGKTFSVTGWKTGWAYGPARLLRNLQIVHTGSVFTCATPIQEALARALEIELERRDSPDCYFVSLARDLKHKRDFLLQTLKEIGFKPTLPEGGYFIVADWTGLENKLSLSSEIDACKSYKFTKKLFKETGVLIIPHSAFYSEPDKKLGENYARFCFIKKDEQLALTAKLLQDWNASTVSTT